VRTSEAPPRQGERAYLVTESGAAAYYWEYLAAMPASHFASTYSYVASTTGDSIAGSNPTTAFLVAGYTLNDTQWFPSDPDSGYSVDDLAPAAPAPFTGQYAGGATALHWEPNDETDLAGYRLYRGGSAGFVPGPGNLVSDQPDTGYVDAGPAGSWYKLSAVDAHGNESVFAVLSPSGTVEVPEGSAPHALWLAPPSPNPARGSTTLRLALPRAGHATLTLHDASGRLVRTLHDGALAAGEHALRWDGRGAGERLAPAGLYFVRLTAGGRTLNTRFVAIR
jgi:hypothetical protein